MKTDKKRPDPTECDHSVAIIPPTAILPPYTDYGDTVPRVHDPRGLPEGYSNHVIGMAVFLMSNAATGSTKQDLARLLVGYLNELVQQREAAIKRIISGTLLYNHNMVSR